MLESETPRAVVNFLNRKSLGLSKRRSFKKLLLELWFFFFLYKSSNSHWSFTNENMKPLAVKTRDQECIALNQSYLVDKWSSRIFTLLYFFTQLISVHSNLNAELMLPLPGCRVTKMDNRMIECWFTGNFYNPEHPAKWSYWVMAPNIPQSIFI